MKLINAQLKGLRTYVCGEVVTFDDKGIATFTQEKAYKEALCLPYFTEVKEKKAQPTVDEVAKEVKPQEIKEEPKPTTSTTKTPAKTATKTATTPKKTATK